MPQFVRSGLKPDRWLAYPEISWLAAGQVQADALLDLKTVNNELSVYEVADLAAAERAAVAVAAGSQNPGDIGFVIFDSAPLAPLALDLKKTRGGTADDTVNEWHWDLRRLTATQLAGIAGVILQVEMQFILRKRVRELVKEGINTSRLDRNRVHEKLRSELGL